MAYRPDSSYGKFFSDFKNFNNGSTLGIYILELVVMKC